MHAIIINSRFANASWLAKFSATSSF